MQATALIIAALAQGGPPFLTDDPGTPGDGRWEINLAFTSEIRPSEELYDLRADPDCMNNLAAETAHSARRAAMQKQLFAELEAQQDPRMRGEGAVFDRYHIVSTEDVSNAMRKLESASLANGAKLVQTGRVDSRKLLMGL